MDEIKAPLTVVVFFAGTKGQLIIIQTHNKAEVDFFISCLPWALISFQGPFEVSADLEITTHPFSNRGFLFLTVDRCKFSIWLCHYYHIENGTFRRPLQNM